MPQVGYNVWKMIFLRRTPVHTRTTYGVCIDHINIPHALSQTDNNMHRTKVWKRTGDLTSKTRQEKTTWTTSTHAKHRRKSSILLASACNQGAYHPGVVDGHKWIGHETRTVHKEHRPSKNAGPGYVCSVEDTQVCGQWWSAGKSNLNNFEKWF